MCNSNEKSYQKITTSITVIFINFSGGKKRARNYFANLWFIYWKKVLSSEESQLRPRAVYMSVFYERFV